MNFANLLSLSRLLLSPFVMVFFARKNLTGVIILWILAAVTDFLDGWVARNYGEISELGKILDPVADKATLAFSFLSLMLWFELPPWLGWVYIIKELLQLTGGLIFLKLKQKVVPSNYWGKTSTFLFFVGFFSYCLNPQVGVIILYIALVLSLIAFGTYTKKILE